MEVVKIIKDIPLEEGLYHVYIKSCFCGDMGDFRKKIS